MPDPGQARCWPPQRPGIGVVAAIAGGCFAPKKLVATSAANRLCDDLATITRRFQQSRPSGPYAASDRSGVNYPGRSWIRNQGSACWGRRNNRGLSLRCKRPGGVHEALKFLHLFDEMRPRIEPSSRHSLSMAKNSSAPPPYTLAIRVCAASRAPSLLKRLGVHSSQN
jgi:hypothetical protein